MRNCKFTKSYSNSIFRTDYQQIKQYIQNNYLLSNNLDYRIKFTDLLNLTIQEMHVEVNSHKFVKFVLSRILQELKLEKKDIVMVFIGMELNQMFNQKTVRMMKSSLKYQLFIMMMSFKNIKIYVNYILIIQIILKLRLNLKK